MIKSISPPNLGWLEKKLSDKEIDYLWRCIDNKKRNRGNAGGVYDLMDRGDWFWLNTLKPLCEKYKEDFDDISNGYSTFMVRWWVHYQKQTDLNLNLFVVL